MAVYFFDSSALVKRYVAETGTGWVRSLTDTAAGNRIYVARITGTEVVAAITRKLRGGFVPASDAAAAIASFRYELTNELRPIEIVSALIDRAMLLAERHALRGYDAVQLASALETANERRSLGLSALTLISADGDLNTAAVAEGLTTDDPHTH